MNWGKKSQVYTFRYMSLHFLGGINAAVTATPQALGRLSKISIFGVKIMY